MKQKHKEMKQYGTTQCKVVENTLCPFCHTVREQNEYGFPAYSQMRTTAGHELATHYTQHAPFFALNLKTKCQMQILNCLHRVYNLITSKTISNMALNVETFSVFSLKTSLLQ